MVPTKKKEEDVVYNHIALYIRESKKTQNDVSREKAWDWGWFLYSFWYFSEFSKLSVMNIYYICSQNENQKMSSLFKECEWDLCRQWL